MPFGHLSTSHHWKIIINGGTFSPKNRYNTTYVVLRKHGAETNSTAWMQRVEIDPNSAYITKPTEVNKRQASRDNINTTQAQTRNRLEQLFIRDARIKNLRS